MSFDAQRGTFHRAGLQGNNLDWLRGNLFAKHKRAPVELAVPAVEEIFRPAAQRPDGEVEAKRRNGMQSEGKRFCRARSVIAFHGGPRGFVSDIARSASHIAIIYREHACAQMRMASTEVMFFDASDFSIRKVHLPRTLNGMYPNF